jgi:hypothetical protein
MLEFVHINHCVSSKEMFANLQAQAVKERE